MRAQCWISKQLHKGFFVFFIDMSLKDFVVIFSTLQPNKTRGTCFQENLWKVLMMLVGCCSFLGYFSMTQAFNLVFSGLWRPLSVVSFTLVTFVCLLLPDFSIASLSDFTASVTVFRRRLPPWSIVYLALLPHILAELLAQMTAGTLHLESSSMYALLELTLVASIWIHDALVANTIALWLWL